MRGIRGMIAVTLALSFCFSVARATSISMDSTTIEFFDRQYEKKVKVLVTIDVPTLPANLTIIDLMKELGASDMDIDTVKRFMNTEKISKELEICINEKTCLKIRLIGQEHDKTIDKSVEQKKTKPASFFPKRDVGIYLGFNQWNPVNVIRQDNKINDWRSRYIAFSFKKYTYLGRTDKLEFAVGTAPEVAWYNFHLKNDRQIVEQGELTIFETSVNRLKKSKLVVPMINLPVSINIGIRESGWMLSTGPTIGLRYGGFSKVKSKEDGRMKTKNDFNMSTLFIGWHAEVGKVSGVKFFLKNDFTSLFQSDGRAERVWSIGVRI